MAYLKLHPESGGTDVTALPAGFPQGGTGKSVKKGAGNL